METKQTQFDSFKFDVGGEKGSFEGYASIFNKVDLQDDLVEPGAFAKSIKHHRGSFPLLWQHDRAQPIGIVEAEEDERGLRVKGRLALGVSKARDVYELLRAKIIAGLSIGYKAVKEGVDRKTGVRRLKEILLWEISAVTFPANPEARVLGVKHDGEGEPKPFDWQAEPLYREGKDDAPFSWVREMRLHSSR